MKRVISLFLSLVMALSLMSTALATDDGFTGSGCHNVDKLSKEEIKTLIDTTKFENPTSDRWVTPPSTSRWAAGSLTTSLQEKALARLNAWRKIAGLPAVGLNEDYSNLCQYSSLIQAVIGTGLNHYPEQPSGMPDDVYKLAYDGASSSNLAAGVDFSEAIDELVADKWGRNISTVGHRRWFFSPVMGYTGFGYVENSNSKYKYFTSAYAIDKSSKVPSYDYIAWPSSGNFPSNTRAFTNTTPWSVSLNPALYGGMSPKDIKVKLTRCSDSRSWYFDFDQQYTPENEGLWYTVDTKKIGTSPAIIFRPDDVEVYEGLWTVSITLDNVAGGLTQSIEYSVDFFDTNDYVAVDDVAPMRDLVTFNDVDTANWASSYITRAANDGAILGIRPGVYAPSRNVTGYEFVTILLRGVFGVDVNTVDCVPWYSDVDKLAEEYGLWSQCYDIDKEASLNRFQMAQILSNAAHYAGLPAPMGVSSNFNDVIGSTYEGAVNTCTLYGLLQGVNSTTFDGTSSMTRAQAAAVYCRLKDAVSAF